LKDREEAYMIEKGYVVKNPDGSPFRIPENWFTESLFMDFSNDEGKKWWFDKRQYLIDFGVDGFKSDGGEFVFGEGLQ
ncbi:glycosyl hydrolase, partial [Listeria monocytogenes]|uniref:TIM-barrel domain-containing protein n=1 Tax=Listeria monocytogenes TaxID=1639 RepID=UPI000D81D33D